MDAQKVGKQLLGREVPANAARKAWYVTKQRNTVAVQQEQDLYRIYTLRDLGYDPYVMVYNKPSAPKEIRHLQRWCNNKIIFNSVKRFEDYMS